MALTDKLTAIGDAIREKTETTELIPLGDMPGKVDEVYEAGRKAEYDKFWDTFQNYGNRTHYDRSGGRNFPQECWDFSLFYPKYDIKPTTAEQMFYNWSEERHRGDLAQRLRDCGVVLDTSKCTNLLGAFQYAYFTRIPPIDLTGIVASYYVNYLFGNTERDRVDIVIEKIIVNENTPYTLMFSSARGIKSLTIEGTIGQNELNVSACEKLTHDSLMSIINALKTFTDGTTKTVTLGATNIAKLTDAEKAIATQKGWTLA